MKTYGHRNYRITIRLHFSKTTVKIKARLMKFLLTMSKTTEIIKVFTDGSCLGNPGPGGWAAILQYKQREKILQGHTPSTTNNRMEMTAAINALRQIKSATPIALYTDSQYLRQGILTWMPKWKQNKWRTANKKPVKNRDLWEELDGLVAQHTIEWHWVRAHAGHPENERADELARSAIPGSTTS
jgi:ribonuclease HI